MKRLLLAAALVSANALAQQPDYSKVEIKATHVAGTVWMLEGAGGNIAVSVGDDGIVMIDDQFAPLAPKIKAALAKLSQKPVRFLVNTHWHFDHVGGNAATRSSSSPRATSCTWETTSSPPAFPSSISRAVAAHADWWPRSTR